MAESPSPINEPRRPDRSSRPLEPFKFMTETGVVRWTGYVAENIESLLQGLRKVPGSSIYYHVHHAVFRRPRYTSAEHTNDFARWTLRVLGKTVLAEKLSSVDPLEASTVRQAREQLVGCVEDYVAEGEVFARVPRGQELYFLEAKSFVLPTLVHAADARQLASGIEKLGAGCVLYHFIEARFRDGKGTNDFSEWLRRIGETEMAIALERVNPYFHDMAALRTQIIEVLRG